MVSSGSGLLCLACFLDLAFRGILVQVLQSGYFLHRCPQPPAVLRDSVLGQAGQSLHLTLLPPKPLHRRPPKHGEIFRGFSRWNFGASKQVVWDIPKIRAKNLSKNPCKNLYKNPLQNVCTKTLYKSPCKISVKKIGAKNPCRNPEQTLQISKHKICNEIC